MAAKKKTVANVATTSVGSNIQQAIQSIRCARGFIAKLSAERTTEQLSISSLSSIARDLSNIEARLEEYA